MKLVKVYSLNEKTSIAYLYVHAWCMLQSLQFVLSSHDVCWISFLEDVFATTILLTKTTAECLE